MSLDLPLIPGILILLFVYIILTRVWMEVANYIGEKSIMVFKTLWEAIKK